jgi:hypothetical protein
MFCILQIWLDLKIRKNPFWNGGLGRPTVNSLTRSFKKTEVPTCQPPDTESVRRGVPAQPARHPSPGRSATSPTVTLPSFPAIRRQKPGGKPCFLLPFLSQDQAFTRCCSSSVSHQLQLPSFNSSRSQLPLDLTVLLVQVSQLVTASSSPHRGSWHRPCRSTVSSASAVAHRRELSQRVT